MFFNLLIISSLLVKIQSFAFFIRRSSFPFSQQSSIISVAIRFIEKFKARSHFLNFVRETIEDGRKASFDLNDGKEQF